MSNKSKRMTNIELLRIITMIGVIILHYNNANIGGALKYVNSNTVNETFLLILESLCVCAVDLFIIVSGFFMIGNNKRTLKKPVLLVTQVMIFNEALYLARTIIGNNDIPQFRTVFEMLIPNNYFVILYIVVYIISPYINKLIYSLEYYEYRKLVIVLFFIFSVWCTLADALNVITQKELIGLNAVGAWGDQQGYTIVNFVLMYLIGGYIKRTIDENKKSIFTQGRLSLCILQVVLILMIYFISIVDETIAWQYCNPLVIIYAAIIFVQFYNMNIPVNGLINKLASASITVFILHQPMLYYVKIDRFVNKNILLLITHIVLVSILIYIICFLAHIIYNYIINRIVSLRCFKFLDREI